MESQICGGGHERFRRHCTRGWYERKGLTGGVLYFPDFAKYTDPADAKAEDSLAPWDVLTWALTNFATVAEVKEALSNISVVTVIQKNMGIAPPLHYTLHDATGASIVIEPVDGKLKVYDNPLGVMTNSPSFDWHMTNLRNYVKLSPNNAKPVKSSGLKSRRLARVQACWAFRATRHHHRVSSVLALMSCQPNRLPVALKACDLLSIS